MARSRCEFWLVTVGEPLPLDGESERLLRTGLLAEELRARGHKVVWWTSTFDHKSKRHRFPHSTAMAVADNYEIRLIRGPGYTRNVSLGRLWDHWLTAREFSRLAAGSASPDAMVASLPTVDLALACANYAVNRGVPIAIDVRDLWPDIFVDVVPKWCRAAARGLIVPIDIRAKRALRSATSIVGNSEPFVEWGLRKAGRIIGELDRVFPFGYASRSPDQRSVQSAEHLWDGLGIGNQSEFVVCFFGTLGRQFDLECVISVAKRLASSSRRTQFVICGAGEQMERYKALAAGAPNIFFPGWVGKAEIWVLMRRSALGLAPYMETQAFSGNIPNKPIEYLSSALPVVISGATYLGELLEKERCGARYTAGDEEDLYQIVCRLYDDRRLLHEMREKARRLYQRSFVAERVYEDFADYLEHLALQRS